jgi:4-hydroxy-3-methylbut-2-enyl diphosphate reductase
MIAPSIAAPAKTRRIVLAKVAGFCFGVRRAVDMTEAARASRSGRLTVLGMLVHNEQVISRMRDSGIDSAGSLDAIEEGTVVLSAHGVAPAVSVSVRSRGLDVVDATCPFVTKVHRSAKVLHEQGYQLLLVGDRGHTEVRGVMGALEAVGGSLTVVSSVEEVRRLPLRRRVGVVSQTTRRAEEFAAIVAEVCRRADDVRAINTICNATDELQEAAVDLASRVEVAIVIGGANSANTRRLRELCASVGIPAYHVQGPEDIDDAWLEGKESIGITAGASTPDWIIEDVARRLNGGFLPDDWCLRHPDEALRV